MKEAIVLPTANPNVIVRELTTEADDRAYFESYNFSRPEISKYDPDAGSKHLTLEDTRRARLEAGAKLRMGVWAGDTFVASVNARPEGMSAEIGYWADTRYTGRGYTTLGTRALADYVNELRPHVFAEVDERNVASERVLRKAGFMAVAHADGKKTFWLKDQIPLLFPQAVTTAQQVPRGEYRVVEGSANPVPVRRGSLFVVNAGPKFNRDPLPGVHSRGMYMGPGESRSVVSFRYNKLDAQGELETTERAVVWTGVGYGEHPGHLGQPPTWYLVGAQIGSLRPESDELIGTPTKDVDVAVKHFSFASIIGGPLKRLSLANSR